MPTGFHPNTHFFSAHLELAVELLRFLAVPQFPFVQFPRVRIDKRNLLEARVIVTTYNDHVRLLSPSLGWLAPPKFTRASEPTLLWNHYTYERPTTRLTSKAANWQSTLRFLAQSTTPRHLRCHHVLDRLLPARAVWNR